MVYLRQYITHHGLGGFSELTNGLMAAAIGALSMLTSEPTAKTKCKEGTYVCPLIRDITLHCIALQSPFAETREDVTRDGSSKIGILQQTVKLYKIHHVGGQAMHWDSKNNEIMYHVTVFAIDLSEFMSTSFRSYIYDTAVSRKVFLQTGKSLCDNLESYYG